MFQFPQNTDKFVKDVFENVLEMCFTRAFQTLAPSVLELFGLRPEGNRSHRGLNVVPPLMQGIELAPTVRGKFTKYLESSDDPEIREWPEFRAQQNHKKEFTEKQRLRSECFRLSPEENIQAFYGSIEKHSYLSKVVCWKSPEAIPWAPYKTEQGLGGLQDWVRKVSTSISASDGYDISNPAIPFGTTEASVGIAFDSIPCHYDGNEAPIPFGLKQSGFNATNSLIWTANFQKYKVILDTFQVGPQCLENERLSEWTQGLIESSKLRVILLCGQMAEDFALTGSDTEHSLNLNLQGIDFQVWLRLDGGSIERIFVRSPPPLVRMWSSKGLAVQKLGALFRFVGAITSLKLSPAFYQSALTLVLIIRGWDDEDSGHVQPLSPDMDKLDPTLKIWLARLGFSNNEELRRLAQCSAGSVRLGLLALTYAVRDQIESSGGKRILSSRPRRRGRIPRETLQNVRCLLKEVQEACRASGRGTIIPNNSPMRDALDPDSLDEILLSEDILDDAISKGDITVESNNSGEQRNTSRDQEINLPRTVASKNSWLKSLELLNGYNFTGHETNKGLNSSYAFNIRHVTFRIHEAPPNCKSFFVKADLVPPGERHPHAYAYNAKETDPGIRFALRMAVHDENGAETFVGFPTSPTWQAVAISNSFVDTFSGDPMEIICLRRRRFLFVDKRIQNVSPDLVPFINGAYRNDNGEIVRFKSGSSKPKTTTET